ncbi:phage portal protein [Streptomyces sp. WAC 01529]|uniref:phage portal protein n=1 Tax=Streptomyces sp. WAC 01529 TaxID=2203205 RepID=UPI000F6FB650|nr:phage portal protein [Streptomyces sp. WAC 01529]AZM51769.1 phage portal protein [Streptomyces sp. WAC 01529]
MAWWKKLIPWGRNRKAFTQPDFWNIDAAPFFMGSTADKERIETDFEGYVEGAFKRNGPIFSCVMARQMVFSEARFQFRQFRNGRPGDLFGSGELSLLERPWASGTTGELLARMEQDASLAGNSYWTKVDDQGGYGNAASGPGLRLARLRPDWVSMLIGSHSGDLYAADARIIGFLYEPRQFGVMSSGGPMATGGAVLLMPDEVAHYSPIPDPSARFRGMSWITPVLREIEADTAATVHKKTFFEHAAVPNMVVRFDKDVQKEQFDSFVRAFKAGHQGAFNAYKTLFLQGGADVTPLTHDFRQLDFTSTVGKGEARIASAAGVPPSWVGFSEGLQGSALNASNFTASRRRFADGTMRPLWRVAASCLENLVMVPSGASLWYDDRDIAFLREDSKDRAEILRVQANTIDALIKAGFEPDAAVQAILAEDVSQLVGQHTGLVSVQMQPPASLEPAEPIPAPLELEQSGTPEGQDDGA